jgi:hypothetical protein
MPPNLMLLESLIKESAHAVEVSNVRFDKNDGSCVDQSGVYDVGDEIPPQAIRKMGVGHLIPIEEHLLAEGEGLCSTQVEPSPSQAQQAPQGPIDANQRQALDPHPSEQGQDQDQVDGSESSPMVDQGQDQNDEHAHVDEQAQVEGQGEDQNSGDDQGVSQESFEEAQAHCWCVVLATSWEPQEEGMMSTTVSFPLVINQGLIDQ